VLVTGMIGALLDYGLNAVGSRFKAAINTNIATRERIDLSHFILPLQHQANWRSLHRYCLQRLGVQRVLHSCLIG
jgi:hypothetical protein